MAHKSLFGACSGGWRQELLIKPQLSSVQMEVHHIDLGQIKTNIAPFTSTKTVPEIGERRFDRLGCR